MGGEPAYLIAFETAAVVVYLIPEHNRNEEVREVIPADYTGVLMPDGGTHLRRDRGGGSMAAEVPGLYSAFLE